MFNEVLMHCLRPTLLIWCPPVETSCHICNFVSHINILINFLNDRSISDGWDYILQSLVINMVILKFSDPVETFSEVQWPFGLLSHFSYFLKTIKKEYFMPLRFHNKPRGFCLMSNHNFHRGWVKFLGFPILVTNLGRAFT